jgi:CoA:oxalate CoA-transferase
MPGPLEGLTVLDFTWKLAGPFCTMILADLGAEVIKIEPVGIAEADRGGGPYVQGISTYFFSINRGKNSLSLNLKHPAGVDLVRRLVPKVDILVENFTPGTMDRLGLGYADLRPLNPRLIYASLSGFGQTGPYRDRHAVDVIIQGISGLMSITGEPGGRPVRVGVSLADLAGGIFTAIGILAALEARHRTGRGQYIDVAMLDAVLALLENPIIRYSATGQVPGPLGSRHPLITPFQAFPTKDGYIVLAGVRDWQLFCAKIDRPDLMFDERFQTNESRTEHHADLEPILEEVFRQKTTAEWLAEFEEEVAFVAPVNTIDRVLADPHVRARGSVIELPLPDGLEGSLTVPALPPRFSETPTRVDRPAPRLGEHTADVLVRLAGLSLEEVERLAAEGVVGLCR